MEFVLITKDKAIKEAAEHAFPASDRLQVFENWEEALDAAEGADLLFVDQVATLDTPHKIAGYERFAEIKMAHPTAKDIPVVLISPPADYEMDFFTGYLGFVLAQVRHPITDKVFRRAATWV